MKYIKCRDTHLDVCAVHITSCITEQPEHYETIRVKAINYARVFDRWGNLIMEANGIIPDCLGGTILWDGLLSSKVANQGVYVYLIEVEFLDDVKLLYRGDVGLIR